MRAAHGTTSGEAYWGPGDRYTFHVTGDDSGGAVFALDCVVGPGGGPPPHRHLAEDEYFYIHEGAVAFTANGETRDVVAGDSIFVPTEESGPVTPQMIERMLEAGPRHNVEWVTE